MRGKSRGTRCLLFLIKEHTTSIHPYQTLRFEALLSLPLENNPIPISGLYLESHRSPSPRGSTFVTLYAKSEREKDNSGFTIARTESRILDRPFRIFVARISSAPIPKGTVCWIKKKERQSRIILVLRAPIQEMQLSLSLGLCQTMQQLPLHFFMIFMNVEVSCSLNI